MKPLLYVILIILIAASSAFFVSAGDLQYAEGEVLYHQNFTQVTAVNVLGVKKGTLSTKNAYMGCLEDTLDIRTYDNGRFYLILPSVAKKESYTFDFTFSFDGEASENESLSVMLTCRGSEPTNITSVVIRRDGTVDNFSEPSDVIREALVAGKEIRVKIPVENNILHKIVLEYGDVACELNRENILLVNAGDMGFITRNAPVSIREIYLVNGTNYAKMTGEFVHTSYATDEKPAPEYDSEGDSVIAPPTYDRGRPLIALCVASFLLGIVFFPRKRKM